MARRVPTPAGVALTCLRSFRGWTQQELAEASGTPRTVLSDYETGRRVLPREKLEALAEGMGFAPEAVEAALLGVTLIRPVAEEPGSPLDLTEEERRRIAQAALEVAQGAMAAVVSTLVRDIRDVRARRDREKAEVLWSRLKSLPPQERRRRVEKDGEYQTWALCERLCAESERAAAHDVSRAKELADLALRVASLGPGGDGWRARLQGYAWAHLGNARRVGNDMPGAESAFQKALERWTRPFSEDPGWLKAERMLDLEASLRRDQRRFHEALRLLDLALAQPELECPERLLLKKAFTLEQMGNYQDALEVLRQASAVIDDDREPRLSCVLLFNLVVNLCHLGRYQEALPTLEQLREPLVRLGNELDLLRLLWLEGRIAAGLGRVEEAAGILQQVQTGFAARSLPYDNALVSLELASLYLDQGRTSDVKHLARQMVRVFRCQDINREAVAALCLFERAAEQESASVELIRRLVEYLPKARVDPGLKFCS